MKAHGFILVSYWYETLDGTMRPGDSVVEGEWPTDEVGADALRRAVAQKVGPGTVTFVNIVKLGE